MSTHPTAKSGSNRQPPRQTEHARPGKRIKRATEAVKRLYNIDRLTPEQKSVVALLVNPLSGES
jgi:hypothetical protein